MGFDINKNLKSEKIGREAYIFNNFLDYYYVFVMLAAVAAVFVVSFFFFLAPRYEQFQISVQSAEAKIDDERNSVASYISTLTKYRDMYLEIDDSEKDKINDIVRPLGENISVYKTDLLINYRDMLLDNNFTINRIDVKEHAQKKAFAKKKDGTMEQTEILPEGIYEMGVELEVADLDYSTLKKLLTIIENKSRLADIQSLECDGNIEVCSLSIVTYYFDDPKKVSK